HRSKGPGAPCRHPWRVTTSCTERNRFGTLVPSSIDRDSGAGVQRETTNARPSLGQVAAEARVSKSTASKVVNGRPDVSAEARARVKEVIRRLGYAPTPSRSAAAGPATVTVVFRTLSDIYAMRVLEGVAAAASAQDTEVLISVSDVDA